MCTNTWIKRRSIIMDDDAVWGVKKVENIPSSYVKAVVLFIWSTPDFAVVLASAWLPAGKTRPANVTVNARLASIRHLYRVENSKRNPVTVPVGQVGDPLLTPSCVCPPGGPSPPWCTRPRSSSVSPARPTWFSPASTSSSASTAAWPPSSWSYLTTRWVRVCSTARTTQT